MREMFHKYTYTLLPQYSRGECCYTKINWRFYTLESYAQFRFEPGEP